jgi:hypothetical protein
MARADFLATREAWLVMVSVPPQHFSALVDYEWKSAEYTNMPKANQQNKCPRLPWNAYSSAKKTIAQDSPLVKWIVVVSIRCPVA